MDIRTYKDGTRFVVVFNNLSGTDEQTVNESLRKLSPSVITEPPVDAKPIKPIDPGTADMYGDMSPKEIINKYGARGFKYVSSKMDGSTDSAISDAVFGYIVNYKNCDPLTYSQKLSINQIRRFFDIYQYILPKNIMKSVSDSELESEMRANLEKAIIYIKRFIM